MGGKISSSISSLPIDTHPGYCVRTTMDKLDTSLARLHKALEPSFFRKLLGGITNDYARGISALCNEDARLARGVVMAAAKSGATMTNSLLPEIREKGTRIVGTCRRLLDRIDEWRSVAAEFEANMHGAKPKLIDLSKRLALLIREIEHPAAGLQ